MIRERALTIKRVTAVVAAVFLALFGMIGLATQAQAVAPTGCTTSIQWVQQGSDYFQGKGNVTCTAGTYRAKLVCHNMQTGEMYVKYGTQVVSAPGTASAICNTGNVAEKVAAVPDPLGTGVSGCIFWTEWVQQGSNYFQGKATVSCDTGSYRAKLVCRNQQTGTAYVKYGTLVVNAPATTTAICDTGNVAEQATGSSTAASTTATGCVTWSEWVSTGYNSGYYGRGTAQCDTGRYQVQIACHNNQSGANYVVYGYGATAPNLDTTTCYTGNVAQTVTAVPL